VTTQFGGLPQRYGGSALPDGLCFAATPDELIRQTVRTCTSTLPGRAGTRELALPYSWESIADHLLAQASSEEKSRA
jgi:hypothetical protein